MTARLLPRLLAAAIAATLLPALAVYKVEPPDGTVTYSHDGRSDERGVWT